MSTEPSLRKAFSCSHLGSPLFGNFEVRCSMITRKKTKSLSLRGQETHLLSNPVSIRTREPTVLMTYPNSQVYIAYTYTKKLEKVFPLFSSRHRSALITSRTFPSLAKKRPKNPLTETFFFPGGPPRKLHNDIPIDHSARNQPFSTLPTSRPRVP